ncbi:MAG: (d)CMP kinase [Acidobacteria bacterium]|nr:(d)CMP kinase [Acidobacteriota bacterium]
MVIAIDGPSGAGKSTVARGVAERLGYLYVDSGAMYRAIGLFVFEQGIDPANAAAVAAGAATIEVNLDKTAVGVRVRVNGRDVTEAIRQPQVAQVTSRVSTIPEVRKLLVPQQQRIGPGGGIVMEGRDIGTVVFPRAELKIFLTASAEVRAQRRFEQQREQGIQSSLEKTRQEVHERDRRDSTRTVSPLLQAPDAVYLDSTALTAREVVEVVVRLARKREEAGPERRV